MPTNIDRKFIKKLQQFQRNYEDASNDNEKLGLLDKSETMAL